eukprot:5327240-Pyramimonas_sp.AAC.1
MGRPNRAEDALNRAAAVAVAKKPPAMLAKAVMVGNDVSSPGSATVWDLPHQAMGGHHTEDNQLGCGRGRCPKRFAHYQLGRR